MPLNLLLLMYGKTKEKAREGLIKIYIIKINPQSIEKKHKTLQSGKKGRASRPFFLFCTKRVST
jgi:hypothetical protein